MVGVESLDDSEKTQIFSNPKPKPSLKPGVSNRKGISQKTYQPKEQYTSTADPTKNEGQYLVKSDKEKRGKEQESLYIKEKETTETDVSHAYFTCQFYLLTIKT